MVFLNYIFNSSFLLYIVDTYTWLSPPPTTKFMLEILCSEKATSLKRHAGTMLKDKLLMVRRSWNTGTEYSHGHVCRWWVCVCVRERKREFTHTHTHAQSEWAHARKWERENILCLWTGRVSEMQQFSTWKKIVLATACHWSLGMHFRERQRQF